MHLRRNLFIYLSSKQLNNMKMKSDLNISSTIEERAIQLMIQGLEPLEAIGKAIEEENNLIGELIANTTSRSQNLRNQMCKNTYAIIHLINAL